MSRDLWRRLETSARGLGRVRTTPEERAGCAAELLALLAEAERRDGDREALLRETTLLLSCAGRGPALDAIMDAVIRLSGAQRGFVLLGRPDGTQEIAAARNVERAPVPDAAQEVSRRVIAKVMAEGRGVRLEDALHTPPYSVAESVTRLRILSVLCVPIPGEGAPRGALYLENRKVSGVFTEGVERLIGEFAGQIAAALRNAEAMESLRSDRDSLKAALSREHDFDGIVGRAPALTAALHTVALAAAGDLPVVIEGESGVGKDLVARAVHARSPRRGRAFVAVNCAALPRDLLESELFGHRRGAFTGALQDRPGLFATANGGTLFLDEIGEMPPDLQARLLRVLQSGEYRPVGSDHAVSVDVRVVAATRRRLAEEVKAGRFREDLYFRLKGLVVTLPPLRERREDIPLLMRAFLDKHVPAGQRAEPDEAARACLAAYDYPGNVRELETIIRRAILFSRDGRFGTEALPAEVVGAVGEIVHLPLHVPETASELLAAKKRAAREAAHEIERAFLVNALAAAQRRPGEAARLTGMNRTQFEKMLMRHGLSRGRRKE
jgi:transcriptional regulator with GAF, ATPase, and Fis domain